MDIYLNNRKIELEKLDLFTTSDEYESTTISFLRDWLNHKEIFLLQTSGSTSTPKVIEINRVQMEASARATIKALRLKSGDRALICINTNMIGGKMMLVRTMVEKFNSYIIPPVSDPFKSIPENFEFDFTAIVPLQLETVLNNPESSARLNKLKAVIVGGAAVSETLKARLQNLSVPIYSTYGMTETVSHIALKLLNGPQQSDHFKVFEGVETRVDLRGCLEIKGLVTNNQWVTTNDLVQFHSEREFTWLGRIDNIVNSGGIKLQIESIEDKINRILKERNFGINFFLAKQPDEKLGEALAFYYEGFENSKSDILLLLKRELSKYEVPRYFIFCQNFEYTASGKIDKLKTIKINK
ncbi:MAG: AMP-binding protein [Sporocytophaga sp.]|uniref:AMP-binding protein n=1 Tax=Sporocytophaga sp. TaxID=2231183 RepID=UPI001B2EC970|nr:AMP-binding protein [Sporocytophaga sp.]MBO9702478.1 AMP-binding protein [Sporocytophaga sp.]